MGNRNSAKKHAEKEMKYGCRDFFTDVIGI